jgi:hypothetical protein
MKWRFFQWSIAMIGAVGGLSTINLIRPTTLPVLQRFGGLIAYVVVIVLVLDGLLYFWEYTRHNLKQP